jgi:uncharacterized protein (DUF697 family)
METAERSTKVHVTRERKRLYDPLPPKGDPDQVTVAAVAPTVPESSEGEKTRPAPTVIPVETTPSKAMLAKEIVVDYVWLSLGAAVIPLPFVDFAAITAIEVKLVHRLSTLYNIEFSEQWAKSLVAALFSGVSTGFIAGSCLKIFPVVGILLGSLPIAAVAGALTYAVGQVFIYHFELGGTLFDFDPEQVKAYFVQQYATGQHVVTDLRS